MKRLLPLSLGLLAFGMQPLVQAAELENLQFSNGHTKVSAEADGMTKFVGTSSAIFALDGQNNRIGTQGTELIGEVRRSRVDSPYGPAELIEATYGREGYPYQYTLKVKRLQDIEAFTVQAVFHNRSDVDVQLRSFDLFDMRGGMGGALTVADPSQWLITPLMEDTRATTYDQAEKRLNEAALFKGPDGNGFLVGPVGPAEAYTNVQFVNEELIASVQMEVLVSPGESRRSEEMIFCFEPTTTATDIWTRWVAATHGARLHRGPVYGWCSWYDTTTKITAEHVLNVTEVIDEHPNTFGKGIIQIDDGYQKMDGDWSANEKFPMGMAAVAEEIRETGNIPGVWFAPLMIRPNHPWAKENPDAIQKGAGGLERFMNPNPFHPAGANWIRSDHPKAKEFLYNIIADARERGFGYIKIDFNGIGDFYDPKKTRLQVFRELYTLYREAAGEDMYMLSCLGQPTRGVIGFIDSARVGPDSHPAHFYRCLKSVLRFQIYDNVWWQNDPDVAYVSPTGTTVDGEPRSLGGTPQGEGMWQTWHNTVGLVGGTSMVSDPLDAESVKPLWRNYEILRPSHHETTQLLTLGESPYNEVFGFAAERVFGDFAVYNLYNPRYDEEEDYRNENANDPDMMAAVSIDFAEAGLPAGVKCAVFDFWENEVVGYATDVYTTEPLPGLSSRLLRFTPLNAEQGNLPVLVGSNLHIAMGATEIKDIKVTPEFVKVDLTDAGAQEGSLTFYIQGSLSAGDAENCTITSVDDLGDNLWRVNLAERQWGTNQQILLSIDGAELPEEGGTRSQADSVDRAPSDILRYDSDENGEVTLEEFVAVFMKGADARDADNDGVLSLEEFPHEGFVRANDTDGDNALSMSELREGYRKQFEGYDVNGDGVLQ